MGESEGGDETDVHRVSPCKFWGWGLGSFTMDTLQPPETLRNPQVGRGGVRVRVGAVPLASTSLAPTSASGASAQALAHAGQDLRRLLPHRSPRTSPHVSYPKRSSGGLIMGVPIAGRGRAARAVIVLLTVAGLVSACASAGSSPSERPNAASATPATTMPSAAVATPTSIASSSPSEASGSVCPSTSGGANQTARITDMRVGTASGYDTLVIQFDSVVTQYELSPNPDGVQFAGGGGKGGTFILAGTYGLRLDVFNLDWTTPPGNQYQHGTDLKQSAPVLLEARRIGDFEGIVNIAVGLSRQDCPTVSILSGPPRLVIQFPTS